MSSSATLDPLWLEVLASQNVEFDETGKIVTFGQAELERFLIKNGPVLTSLTHQGLIKATGSDVASFLQSQLSSDISIVSDSQAQLSAYCDPQGQVLALFLVFKYQGDFYLNFDGSLKESILKRLSMFVMRSDVQLTDVSDSLIQIGFAGEFGDLDIQRRLSTKVKDVYETGYIDIDGMRDVCVVKVPGPYHRYALFGPAEQMKEVWKSLRSNADLTNSYDWNLLNIAAGMPEVNTDTTGKFVAQFLNLDKLDAINFKKGCFPGQEIIARMHYRGKVTKRMFRIRFEESLDLKAGETLILKDSNDKSHKLAIISANPNIFNGTLCLAIGTLRSLEAVEGDLLTESGSPAIIEPLPYSVTDDE
ncbi:CAF17-like 4Fe-4S cluster assembly/insertion protein YgfZ [Thiomicrorhabdus arctica]|uniref:CAF17-like 4Fe-4S cluster assembly/insertion protein YgfZ n=1 Tax=Thiomicrorhabdus arctica TaxID=131540 RepID=UPI0003613B76|nr:folate-binding protein YgfZ [Thiomicrorhabdus arctica]